ncbi:glycosyltransferase family 4 protein [Leptothoe spongobia]|uniref:Glycosyltransferase family 4 protein n=1 Tax=Leptothoe spongobia TAU-MAC 1115 TaxID=1967444 RepID=A0A947DDY2_9CYAN|nr:glycosyltransferase family 4 protein [Leptothoe spongobia]MBT9314594.1 glycosyltransferase family 4 protein [Leptothoe spongobia TAU-MAC 1115]
MVLGKRDISSDTAYFVDLAETRSVRQKVKLITQFFAPDYAATGQLLDELVRQLAKQGMPIEVFTGQPGYAYGDAIAPSRESFKNLKVYRSRATQLWSNRIRGKAINGLLFAARAFLHLLRHGWKKDQVLLLTTAPPFLPVVGYLANLLFDTPYVVILYDLYPDIAVELGVVNYNHPVARLWRWLNKLVWRRAKSLVVLSPAMKERVLGHCPKIAHKVEVIHSWADPELIKPISKKDNWFAHKHGLVDTFTVMYSGNMGRCHDIDTIFEAAKLLRDEPIKFVCIGGGAKREKLIESVRFENLTNFLFLPYQDKKDIPYSMTACDVSLVSVSKGMESLVAPSKLYPALAAGRPIALICPKGTYLEELVQKGAYGSSFRNGDSELLARFIRLLSTNAELVEQMGNRGRYEMTTSFTPYAIGQQYIKALTKQ